MWIKINLNPYLILNTKINRRKIRRGGESGGGGGGGGVVGGRVGRMRLGLRGFEVILMLNKVRKPEGQKKPSWVLSK